MKQQFSQIKFVCISNCAEDNKEWCERAAFPVKCFVESYCGQYHEIDLPGSDYDFKKNQKQLEKCKNEGKSFL